MWSGVADLNYQGLHLAALKVNAWQASPGSFLGASDSWEVQSLNSSFSSPGLKGSSGWWGISCQWSNCTAGDSHGGCWDTPGVGAAGLGTITQVGDAWLCFSLQLSVPHCMSWLCTAPRLCVHLGLCRSHIWWQLGWDSWRTSPVWPVWNASPAWRLSASPAWLHTQECHLLALALVLSPSRHTISFHAGRHSPGDSTPILPEMFAMGPLLQLLSFCRVLHRWVSWPIPAGWYDLMTFLLSSVHLPSPAPPFLAHAGGQIFPGCSPSWEPKCEREGRVLIWMLQTLLQGQRFPGWASSSYLLLCSCIWDPGTCKVEKHRIRSRHPICLQEGEDSSPPAWRVIIPVTQHHVMQAANQASQHHFSACRFHLLWPLFSTLGWGKRCLSSLCAQLQHTACSPSLHLGHQLDLFSFLRMLFFSQLKGEESGKKALYSAGSSKKQTQKVYLELWVWSFETQQQSV